MSEYRSSSAGNTNAVPSNEGGNHDVAMSQVALQNNVEQVHRDTQEARPYNTSIAYGPKVAEWYRWCDERQFGMYTRYTVYGAKLLLFLIEVVIRRAKKARGKHKKDVVVADTRGEGGERGDEDAPPEVDVPVSDEIFRAGGFRIDLATIDCELSAKTVSLYVAAITDLWKRQCNLKVNNHQHPRHGAVSELLRALRTAQADRERRTYKDREKGPAIDGYSSVDDLKRLFEHFDARESMEGLRDKLAFAIGHYANVRGPNVRNLELPDLQHVDLENEGYSDCFAVVCLANNDKTDQGGRPEYGSFIRNKLVGVCPVNALAFYLFARFHVDCDQFPTSNSTFPSFAASADWYKIKLIRSPKSLEDPISYQLHRKFVENAFKAVGINASVKPHVGKQAEVRVEFDTSADRESVSSAVDPLHLTAIPRDIVRTHAGFHPAGGTYHIPRDLKVPEQLLDKVFRKRKSGSLARQETNDNDESDIAAQSFLKLLLRLRKVVIQDAAILRPLRPTHPLFQHSLFSDPVYIEYEQSMARHLSASENLVPLPLQLHQAMPLLAEHITAGFASMMNRFSDYEAEMEAKIKTIQEEQANRLSTMIQDLFSGRVSLQFQPSASSPPSTQLSTDLAQTMLRPTSHANVVATSTTAPSPALTSDDVALSNLKMSRKLISVTDLWEEYSVGIDDGQCTKEAYEGKDQSWRKGNDSERKFYERRKPIWREVEKQAEARGITELEAAELLEGYRTSNRLSLNQLAEVIKKDQLVLA
ncbi:uncharacterized protein JCM15063_005170 [Sporobolomyces koalae]|uniref:uncharacterized protein n=1 Tax=Sporobolomyces koalae TaxID=500713 RepID=UPI00317DEB8D